MLDGLRMYDSDYGDSSDDSRLDVVPNASSSDDSTDNAGPVSVVVCHAKKFWFFPSNDLSFFCLVGCSCILEYQICWIFVQMLFKKLFNIFAQKSCGSYARFSDFSNFYACKLILTIFGLDSSHLHLFYRIFCLFVCLQHQCSFPAGFVLKSCGSYYRFSNFINFTHANWFSPFSDWIHPIFIYFVEYYTFLFCLQH